MAQQLNSHWPPCALAQSEQRTSAKTSGLPLLVVIVVVVAVVVIEQTPLLVVVIIVIVVVTEQAPLVVVVVVVVIVIEQAPLAGGGGRAAAAEACGDEHLVDDVDDGVASNDVRDFDVSRIAVTLAFRDLWVPSTVG